MRRATLRLLVWLILLALPVQGVAASWMMFCGSSHEHPTLQGDPCPHAGSDLEFEQASGTVPESSEAACNACAACFLSMAIPGRFVVMGSPDPERRVTRPPDATRPSHFLGGLERPPRPRQT